ncbi:hypothetical protein [Flammeovirga pacifica]|uniref:G-protein coupled receptors family 1 profile domain-containing protein n=1 Tax=Flammeovirga pacifica TaxID=915059 RepID=A0A1S1YUL1_FLAPC|nr:hypothetical protein [Flammeovirga pacifica]OHX64709.1 hypothetical protein NH26_24410 [Flammeovirga pacifica]
MQQQTFNFKEFRNAGQNIDLAFNFWKTHFKIFFKSSLRLCVPFIVIGTAIAGAGELLFPENANAVSTISIFGNLIVIIGQIYSMTLAFSLVKESMVNTNSLTVDTLIKGAKTNTLSFIVAYFLYLIILLLGLLFFIVPGIYISVTFALIFPIIAFEQKNIGDAISRCNLLIKDNWWSSFLFLIILSFITLFVTIFVLQFPSLLVGVFIGLNILQEGDAAIGTGLGNTITILSMITSCFNPLVFAVYQYGMCALYFSLREKKEAISILDEIDSL